MNWYKKSVKQMPLSQALQVLGFPPNAHPSPEEIKSHWRDLVKKYKAGIVTDDPTAREAVVDINNAYEALQQPIPSSGFKMYGPESRSSVPEWQTDSRSTYNEVGKDFRDINFSKKAIYDKAKEFGDVRPMTFWAFDGSFSRGSFAAFANDEVLDFAGMVMETWNSTGGNPYPTEAVFITEGDGNQVKLIRLKGQDVSNQNITFEHESFNANPWNDQGFMNKIRSYVANAGVDVSA